MLSAAEVDEVRTLEECDDIGVEPDALSCYRAL